MNRLLEIIHRYKIIHIVFWVYEYFSLVHSIKNNIKTTWQFAYIDTSATIAFRIISVYFTLYYLIPRLFNTKKYAKFSIGFFLVIITAPTLTLLTQDLFTLLIDGRHLHTFNLLPMFLSHTVGLVIVLAIFLAAYGLKEKYFHDRNKEKMEREKLSAELEFLRTQLNPHFLFNAINNICVLIREDVSLAETTLLKFSDLLRYQLYDCNSQEIYLQKELNFISNYIGLEKIRNSSHVSISTSFSPVDNTVKIAPFVLFTFIENAFKHKSVGTEHDFVDIISTYNKPIFTLAVTNSVIEYPEKNTESKGIGLQNVKRRLELLYPHKHQLTIARTAKTFSIKLELTLNDNELHNSR